MLALAVLLLALGERPQNGDFEAAAGTAGAIAGWDFEIGARHARPEPVSRIELDETVKRSGRASVHLSGDDKVRGWRALRQEFDARPGATYTLRAFVKSVDLRQEKVTGTAHEQHKNAYVALFLRGADGQIVARTILRATEPTADWAELSGQLAAPETTRTAEIYVFLSMSGELWVDDIALDFEGGKALPPLEVVLHEGFEKATALSEGWTESVGATTAAGGERSKVEIDAAVGSPDSPGSLRFSGNAATSKWYAAVRSFEARPGDTYRLGASFKTLEARKEGIQFDNLHVSLSFQTSDGRTIGSPVIVQGPRGTSDWKRVETKALAPEGTVRVELAAFFSLSGDAWIDRIELDRRGGASPAYSNWMRMESKHVVVRYPKDHPKRSDMRAYAQRLDDAYEMIRSKLAVTFDDRITVYLYDSAEQGRRFTGRALAFAAPEDRTVHMTMENTIAHEMVHVVALAVGYAQMPLFGEGIAVWLDGEPDGSHHDKAAKLMREGKLPSLETLLMRFRDDEVTSYAAAGSFTGFVITTCGLDAFKRIYVAADPVVAAPQVLKQSLGDLDAAWRKSLEAREAR